MDAFWAIAGTVFFMWLMFPILRPWNWITKKNPESIWAEKPTYKIVYFGPEAVFWSPYRAGSPCTFKGYKGKDGWHDWLITSVPYGRSDLKLGDVKYSSDKTELETVFRNSDLFAQMPYLKYRVEMHTTGRLKSVVEEEKRQAEHEALQDYNERYTKFLENELAHMKEL